MKARFDDKRPAGARTGAFVRASSLFTASRFAGAFIGLLRGLLVARLVGPAAYGTWQFVNIFAQYRSYAGLTTRSAIGREIPFLRGQQDVRGMRTVLSTAGGINLYGSLFYGLIVLGCSFFVTESFDATALAIFAPVLVLSSWLGYSHALSMAVGRYDVRTKLGLLEDILTGTLAVTFVYFWGVYGVIAGVGVAALIATAYAVRKLWQSLIFRIDWRVLWSLVRVGLPIMANGFLLTTMTSVDQMLIATMLSREMLGVYGLARGGVLIVQTIPGSIGQMLFVKFAELDGQKKPNEYLAAVLDRATLVLAVVFGPVLAGAIACFPILVVYLLPEYVAGIEPGRLLIAGVFFLGVSMPVTNWCVSTKRFRLVLIVRLVVLAVESVAIYLAIFNGASLEVVALLSLCAFVIFHAAMMIVTNYYLENRVSAGIASLGRSVAPFASVLVVILSQNYLLSDIGYVAGSHLIISCVIAMVLSSMVSVLLVFATNRHTRLTELIFGDCRMKRASGATSFSSRLR